MSDAGKQVRTNGREEAEVEDIEILTAEKLRVRLAAGEEILVRVLPKYEPKGTAGWVYAVRKVNQSTVSLEPLGGGRGLRIDPFVLAEADGREIAAHRANVATQGLATALTTGMVVRVGGEGWKVEPNALYVITGLKGLTHVSMVRLGGEGGRIWPHIPRSLISAVIPPAELAEAIAADTRLRG